MSWETALVLGALAAVATFLLARSSGVYRRLRRRRSLPLEERARAWAAHALEAHRCEDPVEGGLRIEGLRHGRKVRLTVLPPRSANSREPGRIRYELGVPGSLTATRLDAEAALGRWVGDAARRGAQRTAVAASLRHLFGLLGVDHVELAQGWLGVEQAGGQWELLDGPLERVLDALAELAPLFEGVELAPRAAGVTRRGWAPAGAVRCPFCHDALDAGGEGGDPVRPCSACGTVHHATCLGEAGGCTVLGCAGAEEPRRTPEDRLRA